jgi:hypothetical protein
LDIFRFTNPNSPTEIEQGELINGLKSKMWVERYSAAGEFKFTIAAGGSNIRSRLPIGSLVSHVDSTEIMMVENHEIVNNRGKEPEIVISGRGFLSFLDNRVVGSNVVLPRTKDDVDYILEPNYTWLQAAELIKRHIHTDMLVRTGDAIPNVVVVPFAPPNYSGEVEERVIKRGGLYSKVLEILEVDGLGIKMMRPGPTSPLGSNTTEIALVIYKGVDRSDEVIFSYDGGEVESADYLWTYKRLKNAALVTGKFVEVVISPIASNLNRRMMFVDASDIDDHLIVPPSGEQYDRIVSRMTRRGRQALAAQKTVALAKVDTTEMMHLIPYREKFNLGDIIMVDGDYNQAEPMRVTEFVEIEDETGMRGYPTLSIIDT